MYTSKKGSFRIYKKKEKKYPSLRSEYPKKKKKIWNERMKSSNKVMYIQTNVYEKKLKFSNVNIHLNVTHPHLLQS